MTKEKEIFGAAGLVGFCTFLSRILGFVRDMVIARYFGAGMDADAFFAAFRIPNMMRRLFAEGSLTVAFIPVFTETDLRGSRREAFRVASISLTWLSVILIILTSIGILCAPLIIRVLTPGWAHDPQKYPLTILLTRITFPYILLISIVALCMGILNSLGHFAAPALAPALLNISMIGAVFFLSSLFSRPIVGLAVGVVAGGILQILLQVPFLLKKKFHFELNFNFRHPAIVKMLRMLTPALFGSSIYQLNVIVLTVLASTLAEGSLSYLYYADRLVQFPLGIFAIALGTAVLPTMSRQAARKDMEGFKESLGFAFRLSSFVMVPATAGLVVLRIPIIQTVFERGAFDTTSTFMTARALLYYALGLWAVAAVRIITPAFYSIKETKAPVMVAAAALLANLAFALVLRKPLGHGGLALALSLSSIVQIVLLIICLGQKVGGIPYPLLFKGIWKILLSGILMGLMVDGMLQQLRWVSLSSDLHRIGILSGLILAGAGAYLLLSYLLKVPEMHFMISLIRERRKNLDPKSP